MGSLGQLMSSSENPIRQVVHIQVRLRVAGGGGISQESMWSFHHIFYVNTQIVLKFSHPISNIFLQGISNPGHCVVLKYLVFVQFFLIF